MALCNPNLLDDLLRNDLLKIKSSRKPVMLYPVLLRSNYVVILKPA